MGSMFLWKDTYLAFDIKYDILRNEIGDRG